MVMIKPFRRGSEIRFRASRTNAEAEAPFPKKACESPKQFLENRRPAERNVQ
jgi:hypothetical protein